MDSTLREPSCQASAVSHWIPETNNKNEIVTPEGKEQGHLGLGVQGAEPVLSEAIVTKPTKNSYLMVFLKAQMNKYGSHWEAAIPGRMTNKNSSTKTAAECLPGENEGCLGSRSLGKAEAKATQGSWSLPDHDSASPVPRVTCPLPRPWGW